MWGDLLLLFINDDEFIWGRLEVLIEGDDPWFSDDLGWGGKKGYADVRLEWPNGKLGRQKVWLEMMAAGDDEDELLLFPGDNEDGDNDDVEEDDADGGRGTLRIGGDEWLLGTTGGDADDSLIIVTLVGDRAEHLNFGDFCWDGDEDGLDEGEFSLTSDDEGEFDADDRDFGDFGWEEGDKCGLGDFLVVSWWWEEVWFCCWLLWSGVELLWILLFKDALYPDDKRWCGDVWIVVSTVGMIDWRLCNELLVIIVFPVGHFFIRSDDDLWEAKGWGVDDLLTDPPDDVWVTIRSLMDGWSDLDGPEDVRVGLWVTGWYLEMGGRWLSHGATAFGFTVGIPDDSCPFDDDAPLDLDDDDPFISL